MKYQVTRTYNGNTDIIREFESLHKASEFYFLTRRIHGVDARIELEEIK